MKNNYQKATLRRIFVLATLIAGVCTIAGESWATTCFLPSGNCSTSRINDDNNGGGGGGDDTPTTPKDEDKCKDFSANVAKAEYDVKSKSSCFSCTTCESNGSTKYRCETNSGYNWDGAHCCVAGEKWYVNGGANGTGECCSISDGCGCPDLQVWKNDKCECQYEKTSNGTCCAAEEIADGAICCKSGEHADNGICCPAGQYADGNICCPTNKHNVNGTCVCKENYVSDGSGGCKVKENNYCSDYGLKKSSECGTNTTFKQDSTHPTDDYDNRCGTCESNKVQYCIQFNFTCNGGTCDNDVLKDIEITRDSEAAVNPTKTGYKYCNSKDDIFNRIKNSYLELTVKIAENSAANIDSVQESTDSLASLANGAYVNDKEYYEAFTYDGYLNHENQYRKEYLYSYSAVNCEGKNNESCAEKFAKDKNDCCVDDGHYSCDYKDYNVCKSLDEQAQNITRTINLHDPEYGKCIYYVAKCPHLPQNVDIVHQSNQLYAWDTNANGRSFFVKPKSLNALYVWSRENNPNAVSIASTYYSNNQYASDCIEEAAFTDEEGTHYLTQLSSEELVKAYRETGKELFNNLQKDIVILSYCDPEDNIIKSGTLRVKPNVSYVEYIEKGNDCLFNRTDNGAKTYTYNNAGHDVCNAYTALYDEDARVVTFSLYAKDKCVYTSSEDDTEKSSKGDYRASYTSNGGYIFKTVKNNNDEGCIINGNVRSINNSCYQEYDIATKGTMLNDTIYPYNLISGSYHIIETEYTSNNDSPVETTEEYYELLATRPLVKNITSSKNLTNSLNSDKYGCYSRNLYSNLKLGTSITFEKGYAKTTHQYQQDLNEVCKLSRADINCPDSYGSILECDSNTVCSDNVSNLFGSSSDYELYDDYLYIYSGIE